MYIFKIHLANITGLILHNSLQRCQVNLTCESEAWWYMHLILALGKQRQEDDKIEASLGYMVIAQLRKKPKCMKMRFIKHIIRRLFDLSSVL
jgi:hypothetical protein